ncbi:hypothetical protein [Streptomyces sp. NPDC056660]|uniref:hypothetical protein n=1 Tax=Streptomyces sp. NPDC056660 TaxID=3345897 RepID=UPI0036C46E1F
MRTGQVTHFLAADVPSCRRPVPALDYDAPLFFHERRAAAAAIDNMPMELLPSNVEDVMLPVHVLCLVMMGMMLNATPERFLRSTGGLVNPVAIR